MNSCAQGNHFLVYNSLLKIENIPVNRVLTPFKPDSFCYLGFRLTKICFFFFCSINMPNYSVCHFKRELFNYSFYLTKTFCSLCRNLLYPLCVYVRVIGQPAT